VTTAMRELVRYSERLFRERLLELPDGEFRSQGFLDHDGHENRVYTTDVVLTKERDTLRFDFSGSSPQAPGFVNCTEAALVGGVFGGVAPLLVRDIPWNHGILNAIEIVAPSGLICNATSPAPTGSGTIAEGWMIVNTIVHVVSKLAALSAEHGRHAQAVTHGTFDALFLGDRNQHGEPYGTQLMDAQLGGGGASAIADGIDQSGGFVTPRPNIPNVESDEMHGPMLYLFRSFFPDSGGDGAHRGGRAAGLAFTPYGVERLRCALTTQGVESPVSRGQFGGYPGVCNRHTVVRGTRVMELVARGEVPLLLDSVLAPLGLDELGGEATHLPAKTEEFVLVPGDVLLYTWSGGGGFGDPLDRDPGSIARDRERAVVTTGNKAYVQDRQARLARAEQPGRGGGERGQRVAAFGPALVVARRAGELQLECRCGRVLSPADESWKDGAARRSLAPEELPRGIRVHDDLELVEYLCPGCGTLHAVEVERRDEEPVQDVKLAATAFAALTEGAV